MRTKTTKQQARYLSIQALYAWYVNAKNPVEIQADILSMCIKKNKDATIAYFSEWTNYIMEHEQDLQVLIEPYFADIAWHEMLPATKSILLLATYELTQKPDLSHKIIINEAVDLAKTFAETGSHKFINATLDKLAEKLNPTKVPQKIPEKTTKKTAKKATKTTAKNAKKDAVENTTKSTTKSTAKKITKDTAKSTAKKITKKTTKATTKSKAKTTPKSTAKNIKT